MATVASVSLDCLPDDLLLMIFACVARFKRSQVGNRSESPEEIHNIRGVSRRFCRLAYDRCVLEGAALDVDMAEWDGEEYFSILYSHKFMLYQYHYENFLYRCIGAGNPQALKTLFHLGGTQFFKIYDERGDMQQQEESGLKNMAFAAAKGVEAATEVYGLLLITLGGEYKRKGYEILNPFRIRLNPSEVQNLEARWRWLDIRQWWRPTRDRMSRMEKTYFREECQCDGLTSLCLSRGFAGIDATSHTSMACGVCQWHEVISNLFFRLW